MINLTSVSRTFQRIAFLVFLSGCWCLFSGSPVAAAAPQRGWTVLVVVGAEGAENYGKEFDEAARRWRDACGLGGVSCEVIGLEAKKGGKSDFDALKDELAKAAKEKKETPLWVVLIGHGTFDGRSAKFNLRGPDVSAQELAAWLKPVKRPLVVVNTASSSSPFLNTVAGKDRIVITATKSPDEIFYTRFGEYMADAIGGKPEADADNDEQVSLLEAFLYASNRVQEYYDKEGLLATEHAIIDDNGDGKGTRADWFEGVRVVKSPAEGEEPDGLRAHQLHLVPNELEALMPEPLRKQRDELELQVRALIRQKDELPEDDYYKKLEALFLKIAKIYDEVESGLKREGDSG